MRRRSHPRSPVHLEPDATGLVALNEADMQAHTHPQLADRRRQAGARNPPNAATAARAAAAGSAKVAKNASPSVSSTYPSSLAIAPATIR